MGTETHKSFTSYQMMRYSDVYFSTCSGSLIYLRQGVLHTSRDIFRVPVKMMEISALSWGRSESEILIGYEDGTISSYSRVNESFTNVVKCKSLKAVNVLPFNKDVVIATESGNIFHYTRGSLNVFIENTNPEVTIKKAVLGSEDGHLMAVGGNNNNLKIYDLNTKQLWFQAKADRHDELNLQQPVSISGIKYLTPNLIATVTLQGNLKIYDPRVQRRAVISFKHPTVTPCYSSISGTETPSNLVVGTNKGALQLFDIRGAIKPIKATKIFMGSVIDIIGSSSYPEIFAVGMDRYFRILSSKTLVQNYQEYLKIQVTNMIVRPKPKESSGTDDSADESPSKKLKF